MLRFLTESSQKTFTIRVHVRKYAQEFFREALEAPYLSNVRFILFGRLSASIKVIMFI